MAKAVLIAAVPPIMLKSAANPEGLPMEVFDGIRAGVAGDDGSVEVSGDWCSMRNTAATSAGLPLSTIETYDGFSVAIFRKRVPQPH